MSAEKKPRNRLYIQNSLEDGAILTLSTEQFNYVIKVLRLKIGYELLAFNESGEYLAKVYNVQKKSADIQLIKKLREPALCTPRTLIFAPVKNPNPSFYIQKATELGATNIIPVITERSVVRSTNTEKMNAVAIEAVEQCERFDIPRVTDIMTLQDAIKTTDAEVILFCDENQNSVTRMDAISKNPNKHYAARIGPEGGFSDAEREMLIANKRVASVTISKHILRAETAMITALGAVGISDGR